MLTAVFVLQVMAAAALARTPTLERVRARGQLVCGVTPNTPGFSQTDSSGAWHGLDIDFCRAIAAAVLGNAAALKPLTVTPATRGKLLASGEIDVLAASSAVTLTRALTLGIDFPAILYYEGVGLMVRRQQAITSARELSGATICVGAAPGDRVTVEEYFADLNMRVTVLVLDRWKALVDAYTSGRCDALAADVSLLAESRSKLPDAINHQILPEALALASLAPAVRAGDAQWAAIVAWVKHALVAAEEHGITMARVPAMRSSQRPSIRHLLGTEDDIGKPLGLARDWVARIVAAVGNYGEMYERNLGMKSPLRLDRRLNGLWSRGGLHVAPSFK